MAKNIYVVDTVDFCNGHIWWMEANNFVLTSCYIRVTENFDTGEILNIENI